MRIRLEPCTHPLHPLPEYRWLPSEVPEAYTEATRVLLSYVVDTLHGMGYPNVPAVTPHMVTGVWAWGDVYCDGQGRMVADLPIHTEYLQQQTALTLFQRAETPLAAPNKGGVFAPYLQPDGRTVVLESPGPWGVVGYRLEIVIRGSDHFTVTSAKGVTGYDAWEVPGPVDVLDCYSRWLADGLPLVPGQVAALVERLQLLTVPK